MENVNDVIRKTDMATLAISVGKTFEVAAEKVEAFDEKIKECAGKHIIYDRLQKHNKGNIEWDLKK